MKLKVVPIKEKRMSEHISHSFITTKICHCFSVTDVTGPDRGDKHTGITRCLLAGAGAHRNVQGRVSVVKHSMCHHLVQKNIFLTIREILVSVSLDETVSSQ